MIHDIQKGTYVKVVKNILLTSSRKNAKYYNNVIECGTETAI